MTTLLYSIFQVLIITLLAPLPSGIIKKVKAFFQKRQGASVFQVYYDIYKLLKKPSATISTTASFVFTLTPYILLASTLCAATLVPITTKIATNLTGDFIVLIYTLALGTFFLTLSALDTSSTFGGMGSSRENTITALIEPAIIITLVTLGILAKSTSLNIIMLNSTQIPPLNDPLHILLLIALLMITIAETSRIPIDDPSTHLELTMVHEAMILEYSSRHLGLIELAACVKQLIYITLIANIFFPHDQFITQTGFTGVILSVLFFIVKIIFISLILGLIETNSVKLRFFTISNYAAIAIILSVLGFLCLYALN